MCDYTQVEFRCGHVRYTVRAWCTNYETTHKRCPPSVVAIEFRRLSGTGYPSQLDDAPNQEHPNSNIDAWSFSHVGVFTVAAQGTAGIPSLSRESSPVHPIDGFVWQYNVEPARATSEALDASQSASQPTEPPGPQFPVDKKRYPRVRSASPGYQQADRGVDGAPKCCRRQAVDTRVTRIPGTRLRWESVHEKHKAIFPPSRTAYAKGGMICTTTCITSGSGSLLMQIPYLPIYCI
ncbi:hypothetical protein V8E51_019116 [Hyaloscypha variabilis]